MSRFDGLILGQPLPATISCDFPLRFNGCRRGGLLYSARSRDFAQPVVAAAAAARYALDKHEITNRVLGLLRSFPFADPAKLKQENEVFGVVENTSCFGCPNCGTKSYIFGQEEAQRTAEEMDMKFLAEDFFGKPAFLTVSGELNAETYASSLSDVYTFGPTFRAENSNTSRHLAEFWMIEPELAFADLNDDMACATAYLHLQILQKPSSLAETTATISLWFEHTRVGKIPKEIILDMSTAGRISSLLK